MILDLNFDLLIANTEKDIRHQKYLIRKYKKSNYPSSFLFVNNCLFQIAIDEFNLTLYKSFNSSKSNKQ